MPPELAADELKSARGHLRKLLQRLREQTRTTGREMAIDALCGGLESIPVPVLNTALSKTVRGLLSGERGQPASLDDVLELLERMKLSDEEFEYGLQQLDIDLAEIAADVTEIRSILQTQALSDLVLRRPETEIRWPMLDNRVSGLLANAGGGTVEVDEIFLDVEGWEPCTTVDYSVPAAPRAVLHLLVELSTSRDEYPLLALNGAEGRIFEERGAGAERVRIDINSRENVKFAFRLRMPYLNIVSDSQGTLVYPPLGEPPLEMAFTCAPGWRQVDVDLLHEPDQIYRDMRDTLGALAALLPGRAPDDEALHQELRQLGVPEWLFFGFAGFLRSFIRPFAQLAARADPEEGLRVIVSLLCAAPADALDGVPEDDPLVVAIRQLAQGMKAEPLAVQFALQLAEPGERARLGDALLDKLPDTS